MYVNSTTIRDPEMMPAGDSGPAAPTNRPGNGASQPGGGISLKDGLQLAAGAGLGALFGAALGPGGSVIGAFVGAVFFDSVD